MKNSLELRAATPLILKKKFTARKSSATSECNTRHVTFKGMKNKVI
jgi:hypothetical protein